MRVAEIWRYPVKSMAGERLSTAELSGVGVSGDRLVLVRDGRGRIVTARTRPLLLGHQGTLAPSGEPLVDRRPWDSPDVAHDVRVAAGPGAHLERAEPPDRFDVLPLLVATDGALAAFGHDSRRLRPNLVIADVPGLAEREWPGHRLRVGDAIVGIGNAGGTGGTPSAVGGAISALNQSIIAQDGSIRASEQLTGLIGLTPISGLATPAAHY
jgi:hypothetical protein